MTAAYILDYVRTPIGRFAGALASVRPDDLAAIERAVPPEEVAGERYPETSASTLNA